MEPEGAITNQMETESLSSCPDGASPLPLNDQTTAPVFGTVAPNRIFVGGIGFKTSENDLKKFFNQYGTVKEVKIVNDRAGASKGYGFITFEAQEDAQKILQETKKLHYKDQKWNIGPAVRKQQRRNSRSPPVPEAGTTYLSTSSGYLPGGGTVYLTTSSGYPYVYHNGTAYFHTSEVASLPQPCSFSSGKVPKKEIMEETCKFYVTENLTHVETCSVSSSSMMVAQPVYQSPTYHYQAPTQCLPSQLQWSTQSPTSPPSFLHAQTSEVIFQPVGITQESGRVLPPLVVETAVSEQPYSYGVQAPHYQPFVPSAIAVPPSALWSIQY